MTNQRRMSMLSVCLLFLALPSAALRAQTSSAGTAIVSAGSGQIQGKVILDNDGSTVAGVTVTAHKIGVAANAIGSSAIATTGNDGSFGVSGLAAGQFGFCVKDPLGRVVDPCQWGDLSRPSKATSTATSTGVVIRVKKASLVSVRVNDSGQFLSARAAKLSTPNVLVGAFDVTGLFHPAIVLKKDATGISYQLTISVDTPVRLAVYSTQVTLKDNQGTTVPIQGYVATFLQPSSQTSQKFFVFNAVGQN